MTEYRIKAQGGTLYISSSKYGLNKRVLIEHINDLIAYEVKIERTVKDLHDDYKLDETDNFYKLIIQSVGHYNDIELIYNDINNIKHDYDTIKELTKSIRGGG